MKVFRSLEEYQQGTNTVATIGTFDGVHTGHRKILQRVKDAARASNGESLIISFHPHPRLVLFPEDNPLKLLHTIEERIAMMDEFGIDKLLLIPFTREFSRTTSDSFIKDILVDTVDIHKIVIGYDHQFGKNRTGGLDDLRKGGAQYGFTVEEIPAQQISDAAVSSTKVRNALLEGNLDTANEFLGYNYEMTGTVIKGEQLGRKLGFPTANLKLAEPLKLIPANGIYLVMVREEGGTEEKYGMMAIGNRPTVGDGLARTLEVNILDFEGDLYDKVLTVEFLKKIRNEEKFNSLDELVEWMKRDEETSRQWIKEIENHPK